jgi:hypothetical protein
LKYPDGKMELYRKYKDVEERLPYDQEAYKQYKQKKATQKPGEKSKYDYLHENTINGTAINLLLDQGVKMPNGKKWEELRDLWDGIMVMGNKGSRKPYNENAMADTDAIVNRYNDIMREGSGEYGTSMKYNINDIFDAAQNDLMKALGENRGKTQKVLDEENAQRNRNGGYLDQEVKDMEAADAEYQAKLLEEPNGTEDRERIDRIAEEDFQSPSNESLSELAGEERISDEELQAAINDWESIVNEARMQSQAQETPQEPTKNVETGKSTGEGNKAGNKPKVVPVKQTKKPSLQELSDILDNEEENL